MADDQTYATDIRDKILALIRTYPSACARTLASFTGDQDNLVKFASACSALGLESARNIFEFLPEHSWQEISKMITARPLELMRLTAWEMLYELYVELLSATLELDGTESQPGNTGDFAGFPMSRTSTVASMDLEFRSRIDLMVEKSKKYPDPADQDE